MAAGKCLGLVAADMLKVVPRDGIAAAGGSWHSAGVEGISLATAADTWAVISIAVERTGQESFDFALPGRLPVAGHIAVGALGTSAITASVLLGLATLDSAGPDSTEVDCFLVVAYSAYLNLLAFENVEYRLRMVTTITNTNAVSVQYYCLEESIELPGKSAAVNSEAFESFDSKVPDLAELPELAHLGVAGPLSLLAHAVRWPASLLQVRLVAEVQLSVAEFPFFLLG